MALSPAGNRTGARRMKRAAGALGALALGAAVLAGCDPSAASPGGSVVTTPTSSDFVAAPIYPTSTAASTTSATTPEATSAAPAAVAPVTQAPAVAKKTTKAAVPKTTQAAAACDGNSYINSSGNCVERPDGSSAGATALCKDGSYSHSQHRSGTCSGHKGVAQWL
jgi:Protein of unknown function (DUF3761)